MSGNATMHASAWWWKSRNCKMRNKWATIEKLIYHSIKDQNNYKICAHFAKSL